MSKSNSSFFTFQKKYSAQKKYLQYYLRAFWFVPSDVLQRGIEANIWGLCSFKSPVLDIGIGNGKISEYIFRNHPKMAVGIDIEKEGLALAKATGKYGKVMCVNAEKMPFKNGSFATVVSNSTFEHIRYDKKAVAETARVLKKNGLFFLTVPTNNLRDWVYEYEKKRNRNEAKEKLKQFNERTYHLHYHSLKEWQEIFYANKMDVVLYKYYFPKDIAIFWYKLFLLFTHKIRGRELWSYLGHSGITRHIPKNMVISFLEKFVLRKKFSQGFFTDDQTGAQLFMIAKKR